MTREDSVKEEVLVMTGGKLNSQMELDLDDDDDNDDDDRIICDVNTRHSGEVGNK
ncbi:hypothetical protein BgiMline_030366, partial [Biomphalaria glabrata]